jgi:hypothetical protein
VKLAQTLLDTRSILFTTWKVRTSRLAHPLFSYSYELLFPQRLCFDNHLSCPRVYYPLCALWVRSQRPQCQGFPTLAHHVFSATCSLFFLSSSLFCDLLSLFSGTCSLFSKNAGVWHPPVLLGGHSGGGIRFPCEPPRPPRLCVILWLSRSQREPQSLSTFNCRLSTSLSTVLKSCRTYDHS